MVDLKRSCPRCGKSDPGERHVPQCAGLPEGVDPDTVMLDVILANGKYRLIYHMDAKRPQAFRHGIAHAPTQDRMSANSFRALVERVAELEAERFSRCGEEIRSAAVAGIDYALGYTCEFNANPDWHREMYDIAEINIQYGIKQALDGNRLSED